MRAPRPRRWWLPLLAGVVVATLLGDGYVLASSNGARKLEQHWQQAEALTRAYNEYIADVRLEDVVTADYRVDGSDDKDLLARIATREYVARLRDVADQTAGVRAVDGRVRKVRDDVVRSLREHAGVMDAATRAAKVEPAPFGRRVELGIAVLDVVKRWRTRPSTADVKVTFAPDLARLGRPLLDDRTGVQLVTVSDEDLVAIDLDSGLVRALKANDDEITFVTTPSGTVFSDGFSTWLRTKSKRELRLVGDSEAVVPVATADSAWLVRERGESYTLVETAHDGSPRGELATPDVPYAVTATHLFSARIEPTRFRIDLVVTPRAGGAPLVVRDAILLEARNEAAVWKTVGGTVVVLHPRTGAQRTLAPPEPGWEAHTAALSPDGRTLAVAWHEGTGSATHSRIGLYLLDTLQPARVVDADGDLAATDLAWSPAGDRVFFVLDPFDGSEDRMRLGCLRTADGDVRRLRIEGAFEQLGAM